MADPTNANAKPAAAAQDAPKAAPAPQVAEAPQTAASSPESGSAVDVAADPAAAAIDHKFRAWLDGHIANGPVARNTDCWNALWAALPALKAELLKGD